MRALPTSRSTTIRATTSSRTSSAPATTARAGRKSSPAFPTSASSRLCAKIRSGKGLLYAGTETGPFVSFDDGDHWGTLQQNMPTVSVRDMVVHDDDLVAATYGRAFWILDDLTPLRQINEKVAKSNVYLFQPGDRDPPAQRHESGHAAAAGDAGGRQSADRCDSGLLLQDGAAGRSDDRDLRSEGTAGPSAFEQAGSGAHRRAAAGSRTTGSIIRRRCRRTPA